MQKTEWKVVLKKIAKFYAKMFAFIGAIISLLIIVILYPATYSLLKTRYNLNEYFTFKELVSFSPDLYIYKVTPNQKTEEYFSKNNDNQKNDKDISYIVDIVKNFGYGNFYYDDYFSCFSVEDEEYKRKCFSKFEDDKDIYISYNKNSNYLYIIYGGY